MAAVVEAAKFSTTKPALDKRIDGGVVVGSLTMIEGQSDVGKSVVAQQICYAGLQSGAGGAYYTTEKTTPGLIAQMESLGNGITDEFLTDRLRIYELKSSIRGIDPDAFFTRICGHIAQLPPAFNVVVIDTIADVVTRATGNSLIGFFASCRDLCKQGRTIVLVGHSYAFEKDVLARLRMLCDTHFLLYLEEVGSKMANSLEVTKLSNVDRTTPDVISFSIVPEIGIKVLPFTRAKA